MTKKDETIAGWTGGEGGPGGRRWEGRVEEGGRRLIQWNSWEDASEKRGLKNEPKAIFPGCGVRLLSPNKTPIAQQNAEVGRKTITARKNLL